MPKFLWLYKFIYYLFVIFVCLKNNDQWVRRMYRSRKKQKDQVRTEEGKSNKSNWLKKEGAKNI